LPPDTARANGARVVAARKRARAADEFARELHPDWYKELKDGTTWLKARLIEQYKIESDNSKAPNGSNKINSVSRNNPVYDMDEARGLVEENEIPEVGIPEDVMP